MVAVAQPVNALAAHSPTSERVLGYETLSQDEAAFVEASDAAQPPRDPLRQTTIGAAVWAGGAAIAGGFIFLRSDRVAIARFRKQRARVGRWSCRCDERCQVSL